MGEQDNPSEEELLFNLPPPRGTGIKGETPEERNKRYQEKKNAKARAKTAKRRATKAAVEKSKLTKFESEETDQDVRVQESLLDQVEVPPEPEPLPKRGRGRPPGQKNPPYNAASAALKRAKKEVKDRDLRRTAMLMSSCGVPLKVQARLAGIPKRKYEKMYYEEIHFGETMATQKVANALFKKATVDGNVPAMIFWLKARGKWQEADRMEVTGADGKDLISPVERSQRLGKILSAYPAIVSKVRAKASANSTTATVTDDTDVVPDPNDTTIEDI